MNWDKGKAALRKEAEKDTHDESVCIWNCVLQPSFFSFQGYMTAVTSTDKKQFLWPCLLVHYQSRSSLPWKTMTLSSRLQAKCPVSQGSMRRQWHLSKINLHRSPVRKLSIINHVRSDRQRQGYCHPIKWGLACHMDVVALVAHLI